MVCLAVGLELPGGHEGCLTFPTVERFLPGVVTDVNSQLDTLPESIPTELTHVWFLPSVSAYVIPQVGGGEEGLPTDATDVRPLSRVCAFVAN